MAAVQVRGAAEETDCSSQPVSSELAYCLTVLRSIVVQAQLGKSTNNRVVKLEELFLTFQGPRSISPVHICINNEWQLEHF